MTLPQDSVVYGLIQTKNSFTIKTIEKRIKIKDSKMLFVTIITLFILLYINILYVTYYNISHIF